MFDLESRHVEKKFRKLGPRRRDAHEIEIDKIAGHDFCTRDPSGSVTLAVMFFP
jgi:hypothetical protein